MERFLFDRRYKYTAVRSAREDRMECNKIMLEYEPFIDIENFIGWPSVPRIGGFFVEQKTLWHNEDGDHNENRLVSKRDVHPNGLGHKKIAEFLYERL